MSQLGLDFARAERDAALERVTDAAGDWISYAKDWLRSYLETHAELFPDDCWVAGLREPPEARAFGPVILWAQRQGYIVKTGARRPRTRGHATEAAVWRSLLCEENAA